jgi:hypothetical protein
MESPAELRFHIALALKMLPEKFATASGAFANRSTVAR